MSINRFCDHGDTLNRARDSVNNCGGINDPSNVKKRNDILLAFRDVKPVLTTSCPGYADLKKPSVDMDLYNRSQICIQKGIRIPYDPKH